MPLPLACKQLVTPELMRLVATQSSVGQLRRLDDWSFPTAWRFLYCSSFPMRMCVTWLGGDFSSSIFPARILIPHEFDTLRTG